MFGFNKSQDKKPGLFTRLKEGLNKTRENFTSGLANLLLGKKAIDDDLLEEIETLLLTADVGVEATKTMMMNLT
ncbi:MAG: signal recognition particle receptor subunit alpha, partial [Proteobacteria bacterium]|nr:signal recognition particle receptor subunit alpha [Pseudomonadota bacterium]